MKYRIDTDEIIQHLNPFAQQARHLVAATSLKQAISMEKIAKRRQEMLDNHAYRESSKDGMMDKIANYSIFFNPAMAIKLIIKDSRLWLENDESLFRLAAAIFRQEQHIVVDLEENHENHKNLNNFMANLKPYYPAGQNIPGVMVLDFGKSGTLLDASQQWQNKEFVFNHFTSNALSDERIAKDFSKIHSSLLKDIPFIASLIKGNLKIVNHVHDTYSDDGLALARHLTDCPAALFTLWNKSLEREYFFSLKSIEEIIGEEKDSVFQSLLQSSSSRDWDDFEEVQELMTTFEKLINKNLLEKRHKTSQEVRNFFDNHVFSSLSLASYFVTHLSQPQELLPYIPQNIKQEDSFLDILWNLYKNKNMKLPIRESFGEDFFNHSNLEVALDRRATLLKEVILNATDYSGLKDYSWVKKMPWFQNELNHILPQVSSQIQQHHNFYCRKTVSQFYAKMLSSEQKNDIPLLNTLMHMDYHLFEDLEPALRQDPLLMKTYLEQGGNPLKVSKHFLFEQTSDFILTNAVKVKWKLLNDPECPAHWRTNPQCLATLYTTGETLASIKLSNDEIDEVFSNTEKGLRFLSSASDGYLTLPEKYQQNHQYALCYIQKNHHKGLNRIPSSLWSFDNFCISALCISSTCIEHVPTFQWHNSQFLHQLFTSIDKGVIKKNCLHQAPAQVTSWLKAHNIEKDYAKFLDAYLFTLSLNESLPAPENQCTHKRVKSKI